MPNNCDRRGREDDSTRVKKRSIGHFRFNALFALCFVLSIEVLVLLAIQYSNLAQWYASYREPPRSTIDIASIQTAIEYEYRFTEYRFTEYRYTEYRYTEYEYDEIRRAARTLGFRERRLSKRSNGDPHYRRFAEIHCSSLSAYLRASRGHNTRTAVRQASWPIACIWASILDNASIRNQSIDCNPLSLRVWDSECGYHSIVRDMAVAILQEF
jgi:hypothetical protein